jgi:Holliday junction DNA helicase RuvA
VIGRLTGIIVDQTLDGACVLDVSGVGYEVYVPLGTLGRLPVAPERATLHVHTQLREDSLTLYGFASLDDRSAFRTLLSVTGIGPKLALGILSSLDARELADAINRGDKGRFKGVSGVGKKLVERLVLELKDKMHFGGGAFTLAMPARPAAQPTIDGPLGKVHGALVQMGYKPGEADAAIRQIEAHAEGKATDALLREALMALA